MTRGLMKLPQNKYLAGHLNEADLAAYWVFDYTKERKGPGLVRTDNEYAWIIDQIAEYNRRIEGELRAEVQPQ